MPHPMAMSMLLWLAHTDTWISKYIRPIRLRWWWHELWLRADEFHWTYEYDWEIMNGLSKAERDMYWNAVSKRRRVKHQGPTPTPEQALRTLLATPE